MRCAVVLALLVTLGGETADARPLARRRVRTQNYSAPVAPGFLNTLGATYVWAAPDCSAAPYAFQGVTGGVNIPESATNQTHTCNRSTGSDTGFELIGSAAGIFDSGIGARYVNKGVGTVGTGNWINSTAGAIPAVTNQQQAVCALYRPRAAAGYIWNASSSATEYIRFREAANSFITEVRGDGGANNQISQVVFLANQSQIHFSCWRFFDVCEVQAAGRPCQSACTDGNCTDGSEIAADINTFNQTTAITIGSDSAEGTRWTGDIFWVGYWASTAATEAAFGTTRAAFLAANRNMIQKLGVGSGAGSPTAPTRRAVMVIGAGQSAMVGFNATPVLLSANQIPHREGLGATNLVPLLHEGTGTGASESRGSSLCNELTAWDSTVQCIWIERAVSDTAINTWDDGDVSANFDTLQTWWTNATDYLCGKISTIRVYVVWHQGENDFPDNATWSTELGAIQDSFDTLIRARSCIENVEVKMLVQQESTWTDSPFSTAQADLVTVRQYGAGVTDFPGRVYLIGPEYQVAYQTDSHPTNLGQQKLGRQNGRVLYTLDSTGTWDPLRMIDASVASNTVTVNFNVPNPPLSATCGDGSAGSDGVTDPGNRGFEWSDASARTITAVGTPTCDSMVGPTTCHIAITLSAAPGGSRVLAVARTGTINNDAGPTTGARSCIHDSATTRAGVAEPNWAVHQFISVP